MTAISHQTERTGLRGVPATIAVLVVDDDPQVRSDLVDVLAGSAGAVVVGQAADGEQAIAAVRASAPDLVLMDIEMPRLDGVRATWRLSRTRPELPVVLMAADPFDELVILALRAGAAGVLPKAVDPDALDRALRGVVSGDGAISRRTCRAMSEELHRRREITREWRPIDSPLTTREWQVLHLMESGATTAEMSAELFLSVHTVRSHIKRVLAKLGVHSRAAAVAWARRRPDLRSVSTEDPGREELELALSLASILETHASISQDQPGAARYTG